jgi:putative FmdB family regulatory protein
MSTIEPMPRYDYRCRTCEQRFEVQRAMSEASSPARCPEGHLDTVRILSMFATMGSATAASRPGAGGACCGGQCGCAH